MVRRCVASEGSLSERGNGSTISYSACADGRKPAGQRLAREENTRRLRVRRARVGTVEPTLISLDPLTDSLLGEGINARGPRNLSDLNFRRVDIAKNVIACFYALPGTGAIDPSSQPANRASIASRSGCFHPGERGGASKAKVRAP
jgi:hypothetical protein